VSTDARALAARLLFALVGLPALVLLPVFAGLQALVHAHGTAGGHVHLPTHHEHASDEAWHAAQHAAEHEHEHETPGVGEEDVPAPGSRLELPELAAAPARDGAAALAKSVATPAPCPAPRWSLACIESSHAPEFFRSGWPPQESWRSGVAALLCSSHAILI